MLGARVCTDEESTADASRPRRGSLTQEGKQTQSVDIQTQTLDIQSFSYEDRCDILPLLSAALIKCGGWVLDRRSLSPASLEFRIDIELRSVVDLYAALVAAGLDLTRTGHLALTGLCLCRQHMVVSASLGKVVAVRLAVSFLSNVPSDPALSGRPPVA